MVMMRWNLYNGGYDKSGVLAARSRFKQSRSKRVAKWVELRDSISATWASHRAFHEQKEAIRIAVKYSRKTFDAYLNQFSISQRTLLDVLIAENDFFQSAVQLVDVTLNETISAYRIMALMGALRVPRCDEGCPGADEFEQLTNDIKFPSALVELTSDSLTPHAEPEQTEPYLADPVDPPPLIDQGNAMNSPPSEEEALPSLPDHTIEVGPLVTRSDVQKAKQRLEDMGYVVEQRIATGPVTMFRCLVGLFPRDQAKERLAALKNEVASAFALPHNGAWGLFAGSFRTLERALNFKKELNRREIEVEVVSLDVEMQGTMLIVEGRDL